LPGDHLQLWQFLLVCRDIQAKLKTRPKELQEWQQIVMNELRKTLGIEIKPP
jgi:hypothetical protein